MEDSNGLSPPPNDAFPAGLRVLVVDDDPTWLNILQRMLRKCSYEVTTCYPARDVLDMLGEMTNIYDIIITDVNMPDMDGFELLQHIKRKIDLPVILMSVDGETSRVMKGLQLGACDFLLKPVRMKELRHIWQHVFRRKLQEIVSSNGEQVQSKHEDRRPDGNSATRKSGDGRIIDLHQKVRQAVHQIGPSSKGNDHKASPDGRKDSDSRDSTASVGTEHSCNGEYIAVLTGSCGLSGSGARIRNVESKSYDIDEEGITSMPVGPSRMSLSTDVSDPTSSRSQLSHSSTSSGSGANSIAFDSTFLFTPQIQKKQ